MAEGLQDVDAAIRLNPVVGSVFLAEILTTEQVGELLGVPRHLLAVWRQFQLGPPFVTLKRGVIGYPPEGVKRFLREREKRRQERANPRAGKRGAKGF